MLDHVSIAVDDIDAAVTFYDHTMGALGHQRVHRSDTAAGYGTRNSRHDDGHTYLSIVADPAAGHGDRHWAFRAPTRVAVEEFHRAALAAGGRDDGGVGERPEYHPHYYAAFVLDPSGNRIEAVCHQPR